MGFSSTADLDNRLSPSAELEHRRSGRGLACLGDLRPPMSPLVGYLLGGGEELFQQHPLAADQEEARPRLLAECVQPRQRLLASS